MEILKEKAAAFLLALCDPNIPDKDVVWTGVGAVLEAANILQDEVSVRKAVARLYRIVGEDRK